MKRTPRLSVVRNEGTLSSDIELLFLGILLALIPLFATTWAASKYETVFNLSIIEYRYELAYAGLSALMLVLFVHYKSAHRYVILGCMLSGATAFVVTVILLMYNNQPGHYNIDQVIKDINVAHYVQTAGQISLPSFFVNVALGVALILARRRAGRSKLKIVENDRLSR